jgi:hypothetical protein
MSIQYILHQLDGKFDKLDTLSQLTNDTLFHRPFNPADTPESLFYRIKQYSNTKVINNSVRLLMQSSIFFLKKFDDWEAITPKTNPALKTFIRRAYTRHILVMQLWGTAGQLKYTPQNQNMYNNKCDLDDKQKHHYHRPNSCNHLRIGHTGYQPTQCKSNTLMNQMAATSFKLPTQFAAPPIQQLNIPTQVPYASATMQGFNVGQRGCGGRGGRGSGGSQEDGRHQHTPFANHMHNLTQVGGRGSRHSNAGLIPMAPGGT